MKNVTHLSGPICHPSIRLHRGGPSDAAPNGAKGGIEEQTRKLFDVSRLGDVPIIAFVNKLDCEDRDPLNEIEKILGLDVTPAFWPIAMGRDFLWHL